MGNSTAVKLTIVIPLLGYMIIFNENLLHYIELSRELFGHPSKLPGDAVSAGVPLRLLFLYFGLCLIAAASMLHQWWCPAEIKKYGSATEYVAEEEEHISLRRLDWIEQKLGANPRSVEELTVIRVVEKERPSPSDITEVRRRISMYRREILDLQFRTLDRSWIAIQGLVITLYAAGFFAIAVPSLEVFSRVSLMLAHALVPTIF